MKIIDLLIKIANGEEVPKRIKCLGHYYTYNETEKDYYEGMGYDYEYLLKNSFPYCLNDEVEIIEKSQEHKIPEKFKIYDNSIEWCCNGRSITDNEKDIMDKINEILDYLEKQNDNNSN